MTHHRQDRAERTRLLLVEAAAACFDDVGFADASLVVITQLAGVSKGALYFHFDSKEQLAAAVMAESRERLRQVVRAARQPGGPAVQYLIDLCHGLARRLDEDLVFRAGLRLTEERRPGASLLVETQSGTASDEVWSRSPRPAWARLVHRQLALAAAAGELRPGVPVDEVASVLAGATTGFEVLARQDRVWLSGRRLEQVWQAVLPALVPAERVSDLQAHGRPGSSGVASLLPGQGRLARAAHAAEPSRPSRGG
ncbi:ScbR family autoregulator-binding transcription factor [Streptacidiphilus pinicola]|nr:ScbR family autoregulator-binding transcription factor [Streptacidiphilus pinicola]